MQGNKIVKLSQWKTRAQLASAASGVGWDIRSSHLIDFQQPCTFYLSAPLQDHFSAMGVFDYAEIRGLFNGSVKRFGSAEQISNDTCAMTAAMLDGTLPHSADNIEILLFAHVLNFCSTRTALQIFSQKEIYRHLGAVIYTNPADAKDVIIRPIAGRNEKAFLSPGDVALLVRNYIVADYKNHPDYFFGRDLKEILSAY